MSDTIALVENPRRKKRRGRRAPARYKSGPKKGQFMPRSSGRKRKRSSSRKRRTVRNPPAKRRRTYGSRKRHSYITRGPRKGQRRGKYVMKTARRKSTSTGRTTRVRRRYYVNPASSFVLMNPRRRKGRWLEGIAQMAGLTAVGFGGAILTRKAVRMVLREHDTGWKGYLADGAFAVGLGLATGWATRMPDVGAAATLGGGVATLIRVANEQTAPDSPLHVGRARYGARYRSYPMGKSPHDTPPGWRKKMYGARAPGYGRASYRRLGGSYGLRPGSFSGVQTHYFPARTSRFGGGNFPSAFPSQVGRAQYVPA